MRLSARMIVVCATICWCPLAAVGQDADFGIFLVEHSIPAAVTTPDMDLSTLPLAPAPLIGLRDIQCYDWADHTIWLATECQSRLKLPFFAWDEPKLSITCPPMAMDPRSDERIRKVLEKNGVLSGDRSDRSRRPMKPAWGTGDALPSGYFGTLEDVRVELAYGGGFGGATTQIALSGRGMGVIDRRLFSPDQSQKDEYAEFAFEPADLQALVNSFIDAWFFELPDEIGTGNDLRTDQDGRAGIAHHHVYDAGSYTLTVAFADYRKSVTFSAHRHHAPEYLLSLVDRVAGFAEERAQW